MKTRQTTRLLAACALACMSCGSLSALVNFPDVDVSFATRNGDVNGDLKIDVTDAIYLLNYQFASGPPPVEIFAPPHTSMAPLIRFDNMEEAGTTTLRRMFDGVTLEIEAEDMRPGDVFTVWWVIFNNPEDCNGGEGGPCSMVDVRDPAVISDALFATGTVVSKDGKAMVTAFLGIGDVPGSINDRFGAQPIGPVNPQGAEIHMVIRSHGPANLDMLAEQLNSHSGGCTTFLDRGSVTDDLGECADTHFAIHAR